MYWITYNTSKRITITKMMVSVVFPPLLVDSPELLILVTNIDDEVDSFAPPIPPK